MKNIVCTEIAEFRVLPQITDDMLVGIVHKLEGDFHSRQAGYIDAELAKGREKGLWTMIQHWESFDMAIDASRAMMRDNGTLEFRNTLDPKSVKITYLEKTGSWPK